MPETNCTSIQPLWAVTEAAEYLGKSPRWIYSALARPEGEPGSIPHFRVGRSPRFDPGEIAAWARASCPPVSDWRAWRARSADRHRTLDRPACRDTVAASKNENRAGGH